MAADEPNWSRFIDPPPKLARGEITQMNNCEFIIATENDPDKLDNEDEDEDNEPIHGIYICNVLTKQWRLYFEYPEDWDVVEPEIVFDKTRNILYIWCTTREDGPNFLGKF